MFGRTDDDACSGGGDAFGNLLGGGASVGAIVAALAEIVFAEATVECTAVVIAFIHERAVPAAVPIRRAHTASAFAINASSADIISPRATACLVSSMAWALLSASVIGGGGAYASRHSIIPGTCGSLRNALAVTAWSNIRRFMFGP
jgi:hypothetical protein